MSNRSAVDERAATPSEASRRGAHRARPGALPSGLPIVAGVVVMLLVLGGVYYGLRDRSVTSTGTVSAADAEATPSAGASGGASPGASASSAPQSSASSSRTQAPVTKNVSISVLNSIQVQGLAATAKSALEAKGWTVTSTGNTETQRNLATSVVYYGRANLRPTARQIARDLGYGAPKFNNTVVSGTKITVVLGQDAQ